ncbi:uncharacterized protein LOC141589930 [Silene latifolia]|uniref:uncharacterized protein LOC141589930 n=1 Tax=Silene latifolia TaxID=37657 RepID=UPI003D77C221
MAPNTPVTHSAFSAGNIHSYIKTVLTLQDSDYRTWRHVFLVHCGSYGLQGHLTGESKPTGTNDDLWQRLDYVVLSWIYATVSTDLLTMVVDDDATAHKTWVAIEKLFLDNKKARALALMEEYNSCSKGNLSITDYCNKLKKLSDQLNDVDHPISNEDLVLKCLRRLPSQYQSLYNIIPLQTPFPDFLNVRSMLLLEENRQNLQDSVPTTTNPTTALYVSPTNNTQNNNNNYKGGQSHTPAYTPPPIAATSWPAAQPMDATALVQGFDTMSFKAPVDGNWYMDSGASSHMTFNSGTLNTISNHRLNSPKHVVVGNGSLIPVTTIGHKHLPSSLALKDVLVTPSLVKNLISVRKFTTDNNCSVEFDSCGFSVKELPSRREIIRCNSKGDLYTFTPSTTSLPLALTVAHTSALWHCRLGHPSDASFQNLRRNNLIPCNKYVSQILCESCQLGKHSRLPFSTSLSSTSASFDIVYSDLWTSPLLSNSKFRHKLKSDGSLERYKARWVVRGFTQEEGVDYDETFSPVVKPATVRTVLSLAVSNSWSIRQLDVKNAFLHGHLTETVFCEQPSRFQDHEHPDYVCKLNRALYGLKQAPRAWYQRFASYISCLGFISSKCDSSLFICHTPTHMAYLLLYVDDIILTASSPDFLHAIIRDLSTEFAMTDLGPLHYFLGISVTTTPTGLFLSQSKYIAEILERARMRNCKPCATPVDTKAKLSGDSGEPFDNPSLYRSLAGALQYLTFTRPDISYAVQQVCLYMHNPRVPHFNALKRILRYIKGTSSLGLQLHRSSDHSLTAYSDADWAGCPDTRRSTSGFCVFLGPNLILWSSKRQPTTSRSSAEAEYRAVANAVAETCWLRALLNELHRPVRTATLVYCDNVSAVYLSTNPIQHQRTKHIEIDIHFVREKVQLGQVRVLHVPSALQYADIFTKGLLTLLFQEFRSSLSVRSPTAMTAVVC